MGFLSDVVGSVGDAFNGIVGGASDLFGGIGSAVDPLIGGISSAAKALAPAAPLIAPAAAYFGSQVTNEGNLDVAKQYSAASAEQAAINRQFQADMSGSSYQRAVKDLQAAGLNPMMAYANGGASTPSGAQGLVQQVQLQNALGSAVDAYNQTSGQTSKSAADYGSASQAEANVKLVNQTVEKVIEETKNIPVERDRLRSVIVNLAEQSAKLAQETENIVQTRAVIKQTVKKLKSETDLLDFDVDAAKSLDNIGRESRQLKPIVDMIRAILK